MKKFDERSVVEARGGILVSFIIILGIGGIGIMALVKLFLELFM